MLGYILHRIKLKYIFLSVVALSICFYIAQDILSYYRDQPESYPILLWWVPLMAENQRIISCHNKFRCLLTKDRNYRNATNLGGYLFYGSGIDPHDLPAPKNNVWAIFHEESPRNEAMFLYNDTWSLFEITSSFSRYSDFPVTLQYLQNLSIVTDTHYYKPVEEKNKLLTSIAPVLYIQSDCDTPVERDSYVKELMTYINVDSYGACLKNKQFPKEISEIYPLDLYNDKLLKFIAQYKFVIAFENAICDDYVTEKLWRPLIVGSIPIYLGSPTVEDWLPNKESAILVKEFESPKLLAQYVQNINSDDTLYNKFLKHKSGTVTNDLLKEVLERGPFGLRTDREHPIPAFECFVCKRVHERRINMHRAQPKPVYNCLKPKPGSSWEYHWEIGRCQSQSFRKFAERGGEYDGEC